ncbi:hypothetical protein QJS10_CPB17g01913 [Acorus calamus]|uniref:KIB1-4 beta-propeller domain-containing protein n=1 Tax=Acorus calamus TaxID=4465 RepID=A0AAV9CU87_ACOCL|nr:hypothetical protein QJS10_CPB17g01913 [Acorus calamus]
MAEEDYVIVERETPTHHKLLPPPPSPPPTPRLTPHLFFPCEDNKTAHPTNPTTCRLLNLTDDWAQPISLPHLHNGTSVVCGASSNGYLLTLSPSADMHLLNPFTHHSLPLPSLLSFPSVIGFSSSSFHPPSFVIDQAPIVPWDVIRRFFVKKAISFDRTTVIIYGDENSLAFVEVGERGVAWVPLGSTNKRYEDVVRRRDDGLVWAVTSDGEVEAWDLLSEPPRVVTRVVGGTELNPECPAKRYLVKYEEELLQVLGEVRYLFFDETGANSRSLVRTKGFKVFKLRPNQNGWVRMSGVGDDRVVFLGNSESVSLLTEDVPGIRKGNKIYFTDDNKVPFGGHDTGVYDFDDDCIDEWINESAVSPAPVWVFSQTHV